LLKGASIAQWLYDDDGTRTYIDGDLLVAPEDILAAGEILERLGYRRHFDDRSMPSWWREHATAWIRERDGVTIDLHRKLPGVEIDDATAWSLLFREHDHIMLRGGSVPVLALPGRALHVALHAAHHGVEWTGPIAPESRGPIADLNRALARADEEVWRSAAALARELDATDAFAEGLRLTAAGREMATRLHLAQARSVKAALHATTPPPVALGFEQIARASSFGQRVEIVWRKLVPPPAFIRHWDPRANESRTALVRAYLRRPVWLLQRAPEGFRAWREARRSVRERDG
jgi:hypothetical protein